MSLIKKITKWFKKEEEPYTIHWKGKELSELTDEELKEFNEFTGLNINQKGERL